MQPKASRKRHLGLALLSAGLGAGVGLALYFLPQNHAPGLDRHTDLLLHDTALIQLHERTGLMTSSMKILTEENPRLRLVTIDEASLLKADRDPFRQYTVKRHIYADLIDRLRADGATLVAFDLQFAAETKEDGRFAKSLATLPSVLSYELSQDGNGPLVPALARVAKAGFVPVQSENGTLVAQPLDDRHGNAAFAMVTAEKALGRTYQPLDLWNAKLGNQIIPLDGTGNMLMVPFETNATTSIERSLGAPTQWITFAHSIELVDALQMKPAEIHSFFDGTVVIVGTTARGVSDFVDTPKGRLPAVFSTLRTIDQLMRGIFIRRVPEWVDLTAICVLSLVIGIAGIRLALRPMLALCFATTLGYAAFAIFLFAAYFLWLNIIPVEMMILTTTLAVSLARSALEGDARRLVTEIFAKHASTEIVNDLIDTGIPESASEFEGRRVQVTIFYSDIRGFTALAEELAPEAIYRQLNEYFEEMCAIVFEYGGYVDKFIGDALMAIFSAPNPRPDDAANAIRSALKQHERLKALNAKWAQEGRPTLDVGMGLNTGWVVMGQLGSYERVSFTVIGDAVNVAARLKGCASGGQIVIGESTEQAVHSQFITEELAPVTVKGKTHPLRTFRVLGEATELPDMRFETQGLRGSELKLQQNPSEA